MKKLCRVKCGVLTPGCETLKQTSELDSSASALKKQKLVKHNDRLIWQDNMPWLKLRWQV